MAVFRLEPWELPPGCDEPLEAPAGVIVTIQRDKKKVEVALRVVKAAKFRYLIFARFVAQPEGSSWLVARWQRQAQPVAPMIWREPPTENKMRSVASKAARNHNFQFVRFAAFDFTAPRAAVLYQHGKAVWLKDDLTEAAAFELTSGNPSAPTRDAIQCEWEDLESDARFAWEWTNLSESERETLLYKGEKGRDELQRVMLLVMQCAPELWGEGAAWAWTIYGTHQGNLDSWSIYNSQIGHEVRPPRLARWNRFLMERFTLLPHIILRHHACVTRSYPFHFPGVELDTPPTAHEQLEARLQLLEWLAKNVSSQRARWLKP